MEELKKKRNTTSYLKYIELFCLPSNLSLCGSWLILLASTLYFSYAEGSRFPLGEYIDWTLSLWSQFRTKDAGNVLSKKAPLWIHWSTIKTRNLWRHMIILFTGLQCGTTCCVRIDSSRKWNEYALSSTERLPQKFVFLFLMSDESMWTAYFHSHISMCTSTYLPTYWPTYLPR